MSKSEGLEELNIGLLTDGRTELTREYAFSEIADKGSRTEQGRFPSLLLACLADFHQEFGKEAREAWRRILP